MNASIAKAVNVAKGLESVELPDGTESHVGANGMTAVTTKLAPVHGLVSAVTKWFHNGEHVFTVSETVNADGHILASGYSVEA
ncbi:hypothetical protein [Rhizobium phage RHph_X2_26]|nr:hypothetical protein [Rhizobium phage RHph_X2_26]